MMLLPTIADDLRDVLASSTNALEWTTQAASSVPRNPGSEGRFDEFDVPVEAGMVVLDALHWIQGHGAPDLAVRWNCKAAKCGSCSAEVNGRPRLTCKTRLSDFDPGSRSPSSRCARSR